MDLSSGRSLLRNKRLLNAGLFAFGLLMPVLGVTLAGDLGWAIGLQKGSLFLLMVMAASASYIAVPAAMKVALPKAEAGVYLTLSLGVSFPFNITLGLPFYLWLSGLGG